MLTVKLMRRADHGEGKFQFSTKIIEAMEVDVHILRPGELLEIAIHPHHGQDTRAFYIKGIEDPTPDNIEADFYYEAYIENAAGRTTQVVRTK